MYIKSIKIYGFGKHINREFEFGSGLNVIYGENEAGKTTLFAFIRAMFYGLNGRGNENSRKKYMPWEKFDSTGKIVRFGGEMVFESDGTVYHEVCIWGASKREDQYSLNEYYTGHAVKLIPNRSVGEQILKLSADAYDSSVYIGQLASAIKQGGDKDGVLIARLSAVSGFDEDEKTGTAVRRILKEKMESLKAPRGKNGELDQLVIKKLSMQNEMTRLSELDNKIAAQKLRLDELCKKRDELMKKAAGYDRLLKMSRAGKILLIKDKVMTVFAAVDSICEELEECRALVENKKSKRISKSVTAIGYVLLIIGIAAVLAGAFLSYQNYDISPALKFALPFGGLTAAFAALIMIVSSIQSRKPVLVVKNGVKVDVKQRIEELEETLAQKEILIQSYLGGESLESMNEKWREAEHILKTSTEDERRLSTSKQAAGFEEALVALRKELEPLLEQIGYIQSGIDSLRASSNVSYSEASDALLGLDEEIEKKNAEFRAYELAAAVLDDSMNEIRTTLCPKLCMETEQIFETITGRKIIVKIDDDFSIAVYEDSMPRSINSYSGATVDQAYFALRIAIAKIISPKDEVYPIILDDSFVQYDDGRMGNSLSFLSDYTKNDSRAGQVIFATCHNRVSEAVNGLSAKLINI